MPGIVPESVARPLAELMAQITYQPLAMIDRGTVARLGPVPTAQRGGPVAMTIEEILRDKGGSVHAISPEATLDDAVQQLVRQNVGSLMVCVKADCTKASSIVGIITERDVLRASAARVGVFTDRLVSDVMTPGPTTGSPSDDVAKVMGLMTERRIRHLPIVADDRLVGIVSLGDLVKAQNHRISMENHVLKSYIQS